MSRPANFLFMLAILSYCSFPVVAVMVSLRASACAIAAAVVLIGLAAAVETGKEFF